MIKYRSDSKFCLALSVLRLHQKHNIEYTRNIKKQRMQCYFPFTVLKFFFICGLSGLTCDVPSAWKNGLPRG